MPVTQIEAFIRPTTLDEAWRALERLGPTARLASGGTDLAIHCPPEVTTLIDLSLVGLNDVADRDGIVTLGALTTLTELMEHPVLVTMASGIVRQMMVHVGSPLLRNFASIGGHLARGWLSDVVPVLLVLDAGVEIYDGSFASMPLERYYTEKRHHSPHILTAVSIPAIGDHARGAFERFSRTAFDHALVTTACVVKLEGDTVASARISVGAGAGVAQRCPAAEAVLAGRHLDSGTVGITVEAVASSIEPPTDRWASAEYRTNLVEVLTRRCLERIGGER